jgi:hypothetical protein
MAADFRLDATQDTSAKLYATEFFSTEEENNQAPSPKHSQNNWGFDAAPSLSPMLVNFLDDGKDSHSALLFTQPFSPSTGTLCNWQDQPSNCFISRLPMEILQQIFSHTLMELPHPVQWNFNTPWPTPKQINIPLVLCRVCWHWSIAVLVPHMWISVAWSVCMPTKPDSEDHLAGIMLHSDRLNIAAPLSAVVCEIGSKPWTSISGNILHVGY